MADEVDGTWGDAIEVPGEVDGTWGEAVQIPGVPDLTAVITSAVLCPPTSSCTIGGQFADSSGLVQAFVASQN